MYYENADPNRELEWALEQLAKDSMMKWQNLVVYLSEEERQGKTEFRITLQGNRKFLIHPISKDGKTIDLEY